MALKNSQYYAIMREYEQIRLKNHDLQNARYEEVYKKLPETVKIPDISEIRNATALKRRLYSCYTISRISKNSQLRHLLIISGLIFIPLHYMIKQPGAVHGL